MKLKLDEKTINLILKFERISLFISLIGIIILYIHLKFYISKVLFEIGTNIFRLGAIAGVSALCSGLFIHSVQQGILR